MTTARARLPRVVGALQHDPLVEAVWVGGSVRDGTDDEVSDLDLWIEAADWSPDRVPGVVVAGTHTNFDGVPLLHGIDSTGLIIDLRYGPSVPPEYRKLDPQIGEPFSGIEMDAAGFRTDFWINTYKHRKPIWRGLDALVLFGLPFDRMALVRAWVEEATGSSDSQVSFTIHGLSSVIRDHVTPDRMAILGLPTRTRKELLEAILAYRTEMHRMSTADSRLPRIVMEDPLFAQMCEESGVSC